MRVADHLLLACTAVAVLCTGAQAQAQTMVHTPGMKMPQVSAPAAKKPVRKAARPAVRKPAATPRVQAPAPAVMDHSGHDMTGMDMATPPSGAALPSSSADHSGHDMGSAPDITAHGSGGANLAPGNAPAPVPPTDHTADRVFGPAAMAQSRALLQREHGGGKASFVSLNIAEYQVRKGEDGFRWDGEAWFGGDINRLTIKSEGEGAINRGKLFVESAEVQALFSHALDPYWNLQAGVRHDIRPQPSRTYATLGIEGVAPYWIETEAAIFLSNKGEVLGRFEAYYDQRLTQRLILQPRVEINLSAQDVPQTRIGAGISNAEFGLRLRYELAREFAPYVGISHDRKLGRTAGYARADGESVSSTSFVIGLRTWF